MLPNPFDSPYDNFFSIHFVTSALYMIATSPSDRMPKLITDSYSALTNHFASLAFTITML